MAPEPLVPGKILWPKKKQRQVHSTVDNPSRSWDWSEKLAMLNQMSLSLSSSLEFEPLLQRILLSALELLGGQAGILFLNDQQTETMVVAAASGFLKGELGAPSFPADTCLAGRIARQGLPLLANQIGLSWQQIDPIFPASVAERIGQILAVPMRYQQQVVGVIEVVNKIDGTEFDLADQELLLTYSYQAATALENARLYSMTDQALTEHIEELSLMQRIDRELNASLEIELALEKTLAWAMRYSHAEAGFAAVIKHLHVDGVVCTNMILAGSTLPNTGEGELALHFDSYPEILSAIKPSPHVEAFASPICSLLKNVAGSRVVAPLFRNGQPLGLIVLESQSTAGFSKAIVEFLQRLCDHAVIALANALLYQEVRNANLAKGKFVSFVAHEMKNPMASIKGYADILASGMPGPVNAMQVEFLSTIKANVDRMDKIISDLNDQTKILAGNLRLELKKVSLHQIVDEVVRSLDPLIQAKDQRLSYQIPSEIPAVLADPYRLNQILTNLVSNAIKYSFPGSELCIGADKAAEPDADPARNFLHVWVQDSGIGIPPQDQAKIFQQYFRTDAARELAGGTGLGLNISKSLIEMQGGEIWFESQPGCGSVFHFTLPLADAG